MRGVKLYGFAFGIFLFAFMGASVHADVTTGDASATEGGAFISLSDWIPGEMQKATYSMFANISPQGAARGAVVASPSKDQPAYFYHWVRDAALTMNTVVGFFETATDPSARTSLFNTIMDYVDFSRRNQLTPNRSGGPFDGGLGEPLFNADGSAYDKKWGRPQNDAPALRALTLIRFAAVLLNQGQEAIVRSKLYSGVMPADTVIKADLEYVSHHWSDASYDLWEEVKGNHFYTKMVQRSSLLQGAWLAERLGDLSAAQWYRSQGMILESEIIKFWREDQGYITVTLQPETNDPKAGLDVAVILGVLHGCTGDGFFCPTSDFVLSTAERLRSVFQFEYAINSRQTNVNGETLGTAIGRYPEDRYNGYMVGGLGNAWVLATNALAELYYRAARDWTLTREIAISPRNITFFKSLPSAANIPLNPGETVRAGDPRFNLILAALHDEGDAQLRRTKAHSFCGWITF